MIRFSLIMLACFTSSAYSNEKLPFLGDWVSVEVNAQGLPLHMTFSEDEVVIGEGYRSKVHGHFVELGTDQPSYLITMFGEDGGIVVRYVGKDRIRLYEGGKEKETIELQRGGQ